MANSWPCNRRLAGRSVIVSGGARGIGAAVARALHAQGAFVIIGDILAERGRDLAHDLGERVHYAALDVTNADDWCAAADAAMLPGHQLAALVNNAGIHRACAIQDETASTMTEVWRVNLLGALLGMQAVLPAMRAAGAGSIVNVSSAAGLRGTPNRAAYASSKWALRGLTKVASGELGPYGIRVNSIHPGAIETNMMTNAPSFSTTTGNPLAAVPLGRAGTPIEVADLVAFLVSDDSAYITGAEISIDGGVTASPPR
jgi:3alpha(or 20beta)-hydroxysteroid dehydrogenase